MWSPWTWLTSGMGRVFGRRDTSVETVDWNARAGIYAINELLYNNEVYRTRARGGALEDVLQTAIGTAYTDVNRYRIPAFFMPFREIVDTYLNVLPGVWGEQIKPAEKIDGKDINQKLADPLRRIWRASNLDTEKATFIKWCANFGTVGLRISSRFPGDALDPEAVISVDHPSRLFNFEEDASGNVTAVVLKYKIPVNEGTLEDPKWESSDVVETITKDEFSKKVDRTQSIADDDRKNDLGFCPYVIVRHKDNGTPFGDWAYRGSEEQVHKINWRIGRQDTSIDRHQFPKWFAAAAGGKPEQVAMDEGSMTYVKMTGDTRTPPIFKAIVADLNQSDAMKFWMELRDMLRGNQPELNLNDVKLLGNISGEALAQVLKPTEQAILNVRPAYDHGLIRALQMALSVGVVAGAWDLGSGTGTSQAADTAFRGGFESFSFADRPALPQTVFDKLNSVKVADAPKASKLALAKAAQGMVDEEEQLRLAGYTEKEVADILKRKREVDVIPKAGEEL
jgi:hypothetical protein